MTAVGMRAMGARGIVEWSGCRAQRITVEGTMANRGDLKALLWIGILTIVVGSVGLYLGFQADRRPHGGPPVPRPVDRGPIVYNLRSIRSEPDRVQLMWAPVLGAKGYEVTVMTAADESLFASPPVQGTAWTIPPALGSRLKPQTAYHWRLTVRLGDGKVDRSEPAAFATQ
jgi:hypothetical protein